MTDEHGTPVTPAAVIAELRADIAQQIESAAVVRAGLKVERAQRHAAETKLAHVLAELPSILESAGLDPVEDLKRLIEGSAAAALIESATAAPEPLDEAPTE